MYGRSASGRLASLPRNRVCNAVGEIGGLLECAVGSAINDGSRYTPGEPLLAETIDEVGQGSLIQVVDKV
jgi:hypothetical protein